MTLGEFKRKFPNLSIICIHKSHFFRGFPPRKVICIIMHNDLKRRRLYNESLLDMKCLMAIWEGKAYFDTRMCINETRGEKVRHANTEEKYLVKKILSLYKNGDETEKQRFHQGKDIKDLTLVPPTKDVRKKIGGMDSFLRKILNLF